MVHLDLTLFEVIGRKNVLTLDREIVTIGTPYWSWVPETNQHRFCWRTAKWVIGQSLK